VRELLAALVGNITRERRVHLVINNFFMTVAPNYAIPSTSYGKTEELSPADITALQIDSDDEDVSILILS
jgi:hypothetical protein